MKDKPADVTKWGAGFTEPHALQVYDMDGDGRFDVISGKMRLALEFVIAGFATWLIVRAGTTNLYLPFVQGPVIDLSWGYVMFGAFVIVAFVMFLLARYAVKLFRILEAAAPPTPEVELLTEIRDILKAK